LEYKSKCYGRDFVKINAAYSSQECNECGHRSKENRKTQSSFACVNCGHSANADVNAAKNIKSRGYATLADNVVQVARA